MNKTTHKPQTETNTESTLKPLKWWGEVQEKSLVTAKWMALYEAVNLIADKAEEKNVPLEEIEFKPLDIRDYIESTQDIFLKKLLEEDYNIQICYNEDASEEMKEILDPVEVDFHPL